MDEKPALTCLVAKPYVEDGGWNGQTYRLSIVTLEDAVEYKANGYMVLVDPSDEEALTRWRQIQRSKGML
jgi:hypothetical protein